MNNTADRLRLCQEILELIAQRRAETGDPDLGSAIEHVVIDSHFRELEQDILQHPGAIEPWLIRRRGDS